MKKEWLLFIAIIGLILGAVQGFREGSPISLLVLFVALVTLPYAIVSVWTVLHDKWEREKAKERGII